MKYLPINLPEDMASITQVAAAAFESTPDASLDEWFSFPEMEKMISENRGMCIKAVSDKDEVLGMIYAQQENPINGKEGLEKWVIIIAAVKEGATGSGIGTGLLAAMEMYAQSHGAKKMFVFTNQDDDRVIHFYQKNGYEDAGWIKNYQYGTDNSAVFLLKNL